ncbi:MAG: 30S ribosomal protein S6 [Candidatus Harrisonbacteria bacterium]|nr:30S ribosomal protein S6 [Candidatus Harrisonbacteria bacterium]
MDKDKEKKEYEIAILAKMPEVSAVTDILNQYRAEIFYQSPVTEVRLAYPIKKQRQAYFGFFQFRAEPEAVEKIQQALKLNSSILRFLAVSSPIKKSEKLQRPAAEIKYSRSKPEPAAAESVPLGGILTNEALEEKLEEILK